MEIAEAYNQFNEWQAQLTGSASHEMKDVYLKVHKYVKRIKEREMAILELEGDSSFQNFRGQKERMAQLVKVFK